MIKNGRQEDWKPIIASPQHLLFTDFDAFSENTFLNDLYDIRIALDLLKFCWGNSQTQTANRDTHRVLVARKFHFQKIHEYNSHCKQKYLLRHWKCGCMVCGIAICLWTWRTMLVLFKIIGRTILSELCKVFCGIKRVDLGNYPIQRKETQTWLPTQKETTKLEI